MQKHAAREQEGSAAVKGLGPVPSSPYRFRNWPHEPGDGHARDAPMTTAEAARYCGFKTTAAIRKAPRNGGARVRDRLAAVNDAAATSEWTVRGRALGQERGAGTTIANTRRRGSGSDEERDAVPDHAATGRDGRVALARRSPTAGLMQESDLLFPSETGGFRSTTVLDKPFKDVCRHLSLGKKGNTEGDAPNVPRPRPSGVGRWSRSAQHLRPRPPD